VIRLGAICTYDCDISVPFTAVLIPQLHFAGFLAAAAGHPIKWSQCTWKRPNRRTAIFAGWVYQSGARI